MTLEGVSKSFERVRAVHRVSAAVAPGEFVAVLGPSGCGKTTLLRLLAGFERPDEGRIAIDDETVASGGGGAYVPPERRRIGMVFQSYALWPHMTVAENVGYALKVRRLPRAEREATVRDALAAVGLAGLAGRRPAQLSGGQRQRVALARCLAMRPRLLLLDEPLANLDVHLRESMLEEFRRLHRDTGATTVYVTHDQAEAMALADRIAVMREGEVQQIADPRTLYREPATVMVAEFVGKGMVVPAVLHGASGPGGRVRAEIFGVPAEVRAANGAGGCRWLCLREEDLALTEERGGIAATVVRTVFHGAATTVQVAPHADPNVRLRLRVEGDAPPREGDRVGVAVRDGWALPEGGLRALMSKPMDRVAKPSRVPPPRPLCVGTD